MGVHWKTYSNRGKVIAQAQRLARSGEHADHTTIIPLLKRMEDFEAARTRLEARVMCAQLDRLCAAARDWSVPRVDFAAMRKSAGAKDVRQSRRSI